MAQETSHLISSDELPHSRATERGRHHGLLKTLPPDTQGVAFSVNRPEHVTNQGQGPVGQPSAPYINPVTRVQEHRQDSYENYHSSVPPQGEDPFNQPPSMTLDSIKTPKPNFRKTEPPYPSDPVGSCIILVAGANSVGKTSVINRYIKDRFVCPNEITPTTEYTFGVCTTDNQIIELHIYESSLINPDAVEDCNRRIKECDVIILMYDLTSYSSLLKINNWMEHVEKQRNEDNHYKYVLLGNKCEHLNDEPKQGSVCKCLRNASKLREKMGERCVSSLFVSAKTGEDIELAFENAMKYALQVKEEKERLLNQLPPDNPPESPPESPPQATPAPRQSKCSIL